MNKTLLALTLATYSLTTPLVHADSAPDFTELVKKTVPAVVSVEVYGSLHSINRNRQGLEIIPPELRPFFQPYFGQEFQDSQPEDDREIIEGTGSGFIIDQDGSILTNAHVVDGADKVKVQLNNRKEYIADVVGVDKRSDIALLKIKSENTLTPATLGNSDDVQVGDWVLAIGSPFGFAETATKGIVSAIGRSLPSGTYTPFIQTDAAINPGNSGGPLFNSKGEVIGINSQIYSRNGAFNGLGFAIPINVAKNIAEQLKHGGKVQRGWLGIIIQSTDQQLAESFGLDKPEGALISKVMPDSPAAEAALKEGDVILKFNGRSITKSADLPPLVAIAPIGKAAEIEILRNGKKQSLTVTIGNLDELDEPENGKATAKGRILLRGMHLKSLDEDSRNALEYDGKEGVLIEKVNPKSAASRSGLRAGDILIAIGNQPVTTPREARQAIDKVGRNRPIPVLIYRRGQTTFLALAPEKQK